MTPRIDLDVVIDVFPCLGVKAGLGLAKIAGTVDGSGSADVLKGLSGAAKQNDFAAGNRRGVVGRRIGREAYNIGEAVSAAVRSRIPGLAYGVGGINDIERIDIIMLGCLAELADRNWDPTRCRVGRDPECYLLSNLYR